MPEVFDGRALTLNVGYSDANFRLHAAQIAAVDNGKPYRAQSTAFVHPGTMDHLQRFGKLARENPHQKEDAMVIRKFVYAASLCALLASVADAVTVSVPQKSQ